MGHNIQKKVKVAAGTAVGALLAAGAATYFFTQTKQGKKAAVKIKQTASELSKDISHKVSKARDMSKKKYDEIVDQIVDEYAEKKKVAETTVTSLKKDLKSHWADVNKELKKGSTSAKKIVAKKTASKKSSGAKKPVKK
ncbi:MAG: hypothetical protein Q8P90_06020 [bacterium]|nr:hypothetical protein [bacterium]